MSQDDVDRFMAKMDLLPVHERAAFATVIDQVANDLQTGRRTIATEDIGPTVLGLIDLFKAIDEPPSEPS